VSIGLRRFLTDRGVLAALTAVLLVALAVVGTADAMAAQKDLTGWWPPVVVLAALFAVIFVVRTVAGTDVTLEMSVPRLTPAWRAAHAVVALLVGCVPLAIAGAAKLPGVATWALLRDFGGLLGLILLVTTVMKVRSAWLPVLGYAMLTLATAPRDSARGAAWWAWLVQPGTPNASWAVTAVLLAAGAAVYVHRGPAA
jgi:hypothetical protein